MTLQIEFFGCVGGACHLNRDSALEVELVEDVDSESGGGKLTGIVLPKGS